MGGSQGWSSAGIFHEARVQLHRFLAAGGGYVDQVMNYSFGARWRSCRTSSARPQSVVGPLTSWSSIARHGKLMVLFGGANPKNTLVSKGGCASHSTGPWIAELATRRRRGHQHQPDPRRRAGRGAAGMDSDPAEHRHRDAARR